MKEASAGPIRIGLVGYGYWGPNLARNFAEVPDARLAAICDLSSARREVARRRHPDVLLTADFNDLLGAEVDAVVVATPVHTHVELALRALRAGKHVLVEKPLALSSAEAETLVGEAEKSGLVLMVDHTFVYTGAVRKIAELVRGGKLGQIHYYDSVRVNLGLFQSDVNVLWDLAVHDLSILDHVIPGSPLAVSATGVSHVAGQPENIAYLTLHYPENLIAHLHVNWLAPVKVRRTLIAGSRAMIVYDDLEPSEKVKVYDAGADLTEEPEAKYKTLISYRQGDMFAPRLDISEALQVEAAHFVDCIRTGATPISDGAAGLRIVRILEAAEASLRNRGTAVELAGRLPT